MSGCISPTHIPNGACFYQTATGTRFAVITTQELKCPPGTGTRSYSRKLPEMEAGAPCRQHFTGQTSPAREAAGGTTHRSLWSRAPNVNGGRS